MPPRDVRPQTAAWKVQPSPNSKQRRRVLGHTGAEPPVGAGSGHAGPPAGTGTWTTCAWNAASWHGPGTLRRDPRTAVNAGGSLFCRRSAASPGSTAELACNGSATPAARRGFCSGRSRPAGNIKARSTPRRSLHRADENKRRHNSSPSCPRPNYGSAAGRAASGPSTAASRPSGGHPPRPAQTPAVPKTRQITRCALTPPDHLNEDSKKPQPSRPGPLPARRCAHRARHTGSTR